MIHWLSQLFGIGAMISLFMIYQQSDRKRLLCCKLSADICWVIHYVCLGAYSGAIPNFSGIFRELIFMHRDEKKWAGYPFWPFVFIAFNLLLGLHTFSVPINILPIAASACVTIFLWLRRPTLTKIISIPVSLTFLIYDIFVGSWVGVLNESLAIVSIFLSFIRTHLQRRNTNEQH